MTALPETYTLDADGDTQLDPYRLQEDAFEAYLDFAMEETGGQEEVENARAALDAAPRGEDLRKHVPRSTVRRELDRRALNRDEAYQEAVAAYDRIARKFDPDIYGDLAGADHDYEVRFTDDPALIDDAMDELMSCWEFVDDAGWMAGLEEDVAGLGNPTRMEWARDWAEDPHTHFARVSKDGDLAGYTRSFVLDNETGHSVLGVDTIEVDKKRFEANTDVIRLQTLAAIQRGLDLDLDWIAATGADGRVGRGPRQAYGNTERSLHYEKRGAVPRQVNAFEMDEDGAGSATTYLLFENPATVSGRG